MLRLLRYLGYCEWNQYSYRPRICRSDSHSHLLSLDFACVFCSNFMLSSWSIISLMASGFILWFRKASPLWKDRIKAIHPRSPFHSFNLKVSPASKLSNPQRARDPASLGRWGWAPAPGVSGNVPGSRRRSPFLEPRGRSVLAGSSPRSGTVVRKYFQVPFGCGVAPF